MTTHEDPENLLALDHSGSLHASAEPTRLRAEPVSSADPPTVGNAAMSRILGGVSRDTENSQGAGPLDEEIASNINAARGGGSPLDDTTRTDMEGHLGVDLSAVRIHTGSQADSLSRSVQATAFTTGTDVFFGGSSFQPGSTDGRRLLAHELTHVVQQSTGDAGQEGHVSHPNDPHEIEASAVGDAVAASSPSVNREALGDEMDEEEME